jgi:crotonobetainyl-CoA:carnitine CoA-transferase CaiB-like acyl-CoA transferase
MSDTPGQVRRTGPVTGEHTREVLLELGYSQGRIEELTAEEAIQLPQG